MSKNMQTGKPFIFNKKSNIDNRSIPLNKVKNILGLTSYTPPANQEWNNSIYVYNNMAIKNINIAQKTLTKLIKSYFNMYFTNMFFKTKRISTRLRRLSVNKIFASKAELKHTSNKVIITLYVYNEQRRILINKLRRIEMLIFPSSFSSSSFPKKTGLESPSVFSLENRLNLIKNNDTFYFFNFLEVIKTHISKEISSEKDSVLKKRALKDLNPEKQDLKTLEYNLTKIESIKTLCLKNTDSLEHYLNIYKKYLVNVVLEKEITMISYYKTLLNLNKFKFQDRFISRLSFLIGKIYNKEVEFNIVNLKAIYLNSDILTQAMALKLRNRKNRILRVLKYFLYMVKFPRVNFLTDPSKRYLYTNVKELWVNRVNNLTMNSLPILKDSVNSLLLSVMPEKTLHVKPKLANITKNRECKKGNTFLNTSLLNSVLAILKHKNMAGVRFEAKGRLTRRFTASRSLFKIKWKGSLKNIDSTYRGISSPILRGHIKSNVQYSLVNSKTRNGAFGLKGWISGN